MARLFFGSFYAIGAAVNGQKLFLRQTQFQVEFAPGQTEVDVAVRIQNVCWGPVQLAGANRSCNCTVLPELPLTIAPFKTTSIPLKIHLGPETGSLTLDIAFFVDGPNETIPIRVELTKRVE